MAAIKKKPVGRPELKATEKKVSIKRSVKKKNLKEILKAIDPIITELDK
jgi:hypothetical protein